ncbi:VWA domain-containing protein [Roseivirga sp. BDSF3-8]|uniref:vWA domain-containing protein n=1 Tax=Roseivirga sp. BDSF3-8 TaxID=3241598 RepID=UPI0035319830
MNELSGLPWYSLRWFTPEVYNRYVWEYPGMFFLLGAVALFFVIRWLIGYFTRQRLNVALKKSDIKSSPITLLRFIPPVFFALFLIMLIVAAARPQITNERVDRWTEGIDIMLVMDISESMRGEDFNPNRLEAAKDVARDFIEGRFQDRIGLVIFSGEAFSVSPLTTDYELLRDFIADVGFGDISKSGTAIGSALATATNRMQESKSKSKVMILLSDGDNNAGNIDPITAAQLAQAYGIKIYTIAIGREGRVPMGRSYYGARQYMNNTLDETTLREIATIGEGKFYRVSDNEALEKVFEEIDQLEKAEIKENRYRETADYYPTYLLWALAFFMVWLLVKSTFMNNVLRD